MAIRCTNVNQEVGTALTSHRPSLRHVVVAEIVEVDEVDRVLVCIEAATQPEVEFAQGIQA